MNIKNNISNFLSGSIEKSPKYQDFYEYVKPTVDGKYAYMGPVYSFGKNNSLSYKKYITLMCFFSIAAAALSVLSGTIHIAGMNTPWQVAPYGCEVLFTYMTLWSVVRLAFTKRPMKIFSYRPTVMAIPGRAKIALMASAAGFVLSSIYVFLHGWEGFVLNTILYIASRLFMSFFTGMIYKMVVSNEWDETEINESLN